MHLGVQKSRRPILGLRLSVILVTFATTSIAIAEDKALKLLSDVDHYASITNVMSFGANLTGTSDDSAAFRAARASIAGRGDIFVPAGKILLNEDSSNYTDGSVEWVFNGNSYSDGVTPIVCMGFDSVTNYLGAAGGRYFGECMTKEQNAPVLRVAEHITHSGGIEGYVVSGLQTIVNIDRNKFPLKNYVWANTTEMSSYAFGPGQHVASASRVVRPADALSDLQGPRSEIWANYAEVSDQTGVSADLAGSEVISEWDIYANGPDNNNKRLGLDIEVARYHKKGSAAQLGVGVNIGSINDSSEFSDMDRRSSVGTGFRVALAFGKAGFDTSNGVSLHNAPAFRMGHDQSIDFSGDGQHTIRYNSSSKCLEYRAYGIDSSPLASFCDKQQLTRALNRDVEFRIPRSSHSSCVSGESASDAKYFYVCISNDRWKRVTLSAF